MSEDRPVFPIYLRYTNGRSYFKILSPTSMVEWQVVGRTIAMHPFQARTYPDRVMIDDLINNTHNNTERITEQELNNWLNT